QFSYITNRNIRHAREMYSSFRAQLNVTAARIPGQHMQSYMGQTIVSFVHSEENLAFVSPFHMWITGEDFDIDKAFIFGYSTDRNGKIISWSDKFNYSTPNTLNKSLELPIPDRVERTYENRPLTDNSITESDIVKALHYLNSLKKKEEQ